jgi:hypothetical protein
MSVAEAFPPAGDANIDYALAMGRLGFKIAPIGKGTKFPPMKRWQEAATDDPATINNWFKGLYRDNGVGWAMGQQPNGRFYFAIDIDHHPGKPDGFETLADLTAQHGPLPDTVRAITGGDGAHQIFEAPTGSHIYNQQAGEGVGPGIDVRGEGGQIIVCPSIHIDTGRRYEWEHGHAPWEHDIVMAPGWLLEMVTDRPEPAKPTPPPAPLQTLKTTSSTEASPADLLRDAWDWDSELRAAGWQHHHDDGGDSYWTRPGKPVKDGHSAVLHPGGPLVVFTNDMDACPPSMRNLSTPTKTNDGWRVTPFGFYVATSHNGDAGAASRKIRELHGVSYTAPHVIESGDYPEQQTAQTPETYDAALLAQLVNWTDFWETDHSAEEWMVQPILAIRRSHAMFAPGGTGKSLLSLWLAANIATGGVVFGQQLARRNVLYLDYEMTADDLADRLEAIGVDSADALANLHYALLPSLPPADAPEGGKAILRLAQLVGAEIVVIDTFGRAIEGDENDADTVRSFYRWTGLHLKAAGIAYLRVDHAGKDISKGQRGTSAKNDDVDVVWQMTKTESGVRLTAKKRRMGWVPETVELTLTDNPLYYDTVTRPGYPAGTKEAVTLLDSLGIDPAWSARKVGPVLRAGGHKVANDVLRAAVRARRECFNPPDVTVISAPESAPETVRPTPSPDRAGNLPAHPPEKGPESGIYLRAEHNSGAVRRGVSPNSGAPPLSHSGAPGGPVPNHPDNDVSITDNSILAALGYPADVETLDPF